MKRRWNLPTMCERADGRSIAAFAASIRRLISAKCLDTRSRSLAPHLGLAAGAAARFREANGCYARAPQRRQIAPDGSTQ